MTLNLYKISQDVSVGYDTYDSAVVVAALAEDAQRIHPSPLWDEGWDAECSDSRWAENPEQVTAELIGTAAPGLKAGDIVCASYNAG